MGLFSQRNPKREVTTTVKTYATEYDKEPTKQKTFPVKKEPEPEQETMQIENNQNEDEYANQEENYGGIN